jgi:hypothetical protein
LTVYKCLLGAPFESVKGLQRLKLEALVAEAEQLLRSVSVQHHGGILNATAAAGTAVAGWRCGCREYFAGGSTACRTGWTHKLVDMMVAVP